MNEKIAVIGISFRYPGVESREDFEKLLEEGRYISSDNAGSRGNLLGIADYKKLVGNVQMLSGIEYFDNKFFGISKKQAKEMPPEMKISMMQAVNALYDAGHTLKKLDNSECGMVVANSSSPYKHLLEHSSSNSSFDSITSMTGGNFAYYLNINGPTFSVDSTCSSSLLAVYQAVQVLLSGQADLMLAGGTEILMPLSKSDMYELTGNGAGAEKAVIPFDEKADGFISCEGTGFVVLKRYSDALRDRDHIYGTINGMGISGTGATRATPYAPDGKAQSIAIRRAWKDAGLSCDDMTEIEAHGTATEYGDKNEIMGLKLNLESRKAPEKVLIGAVKSCVGHTGQAAGVSSLIKTMISFDNNVIYPISNFSAARKDIDFDSANIKPVDKLIRCDKNERRFVGIDSYGLNGLNIHIVTENKPVYATSADKLDEKNQILKLSAKSETAFDSLAAKLGEFIGNTDKNINDVIYSLNVFRDDFEYRAAVTFKDKNELINKLANIRPFNVSNSEKAKKTEISQLNASEAAELYNSGSDFSFDDYYGSRTFVKVPVPAYCFDDIYCWFREKAELNEEHIPEQVKEKEQPVSGTEKNDVTSEIKEMWKEILETEEDIPTNETFFDLGGNSMLGTMLIEGITDKFNVEMEIADLYTYGTIEEMAEFVLNGGSGNEEAVAENNSETAETTATEVSDASEKSVSDDRKNEIISDIKEMWKEILETEEDIPTNETFFDLGGNSMLGTMLIEGITDKFNVEMEIADLYTYGTIEEMAEFVLNGGSGNEEAVAENNSETAETTATEVSDASEKSVSDDKKNEIISDIKEMWKEVLETEEDIPTDETFFDLGGNTLLADELANRISEKFGVQFASNDLYIYDNIESIFSYVSSLK